MVTPFITSRACSTLTARVEMGAQNQPAIYCASVTEATLASRARSQVQTLFSPNSATGRRR
ncbi:hypothetical protein KCP78_07555 [Salmonella enterica subsp. enterica]|nr:hypothetical protein KCP78_07555 [Salmonella enterica subsp. enterica]